MGKEKAGPSTARPMRVASVGMTISFELPALLINKQLVPGCVPVASIEMTGPRRIQAPRIHDERHRSC